MCDIYRKTAVLAKWARWQRYSGPTVQPTNHGTARDNIRMQSGRQRRRLAGGMIEGWSGRLDGMRVVELATECMRDVATV